MSENRSVKITVVITPALAARLDAYAQRSRWSRSTAAAVLIESGVTAAEKEDQS